MIDTHDNLQINESFVHIKPILDVHQFIHLVPILQQKKNNYVISNWQTNRNYLKLPICVSVNRNKTEKEYSIYLFYSNISFSKKITIKQ